MFRDNSLKLPNKAKELNSKIKCTLWCDVVYLATFFDKASSLRLGIWQPLFRQHYLYGEGCFFVLRTSYTHQGRALVVCSLLQREIATYNECFLSMQSYLVNHVLVVFIRNLAISLKYSCI